jgi:hypothetical protein
MRGWLRGERSKPPAAAADLGRDHHPYGELHQRERRLGEPDRAGGELADGDLGGGRAQEVARNQHEQRWHH